MLLPAESDFLAFPHGPIFAVCSLSSVQRHFSGVRYPFPLPLPRASARLRASDMGIYDMTVIRYSYVYHFVTPPCLRVLPDLRYGYLWKCSSTVQRFPAPDSLASGDFRVYRNFRRPCPPSTFGRCKYRLIFAKCEPGALTAPGPLTMVL